MEIDRKLLEGLKYSKILDKEKELDWELTFRLMTDEGAMITIDSHHRKGEKCAAVLIIDKDELITLVGVESLIKEVFKHEPIYKAIESYDPMESLCMIFVRDGRVTATAVGLDGGFGSF